MGVSWEPLSIEKDSSCDTGSNRPYNTGSINITDKIFSLSTPW